MYSGGDEYVPALAEQLAQGHRVVTAMGACSQPGAWTRQVHVIEDANHALDGHESTFVEMVLKFALACFSAPDGGIRDTD